MLLRRNGFFVAILLAALAGGAGLSMRNSLGGPLSVTAQTRDAAGHKVRQKVALDPARTAIVVIDMWDRHWCATFTMRVGNLVPRMNRVMDAARKLGIQVVFAPSDVVEFYRDAPQRQAMLAIPQHPEPKTLGFNPPPPPGPTDFCECGPDEPCKDKSKTWTRQHPALEIMPEDLIGDANNARELLNLCAERKIDTLLYAGVASNMCVLYRSMGLRNMKDHGLRTMVIADLVEAITSNGLDANKKLDRNMTPAGGSARVQRYIEQFVAPTIESRDLLDAAGMRPDRRPHIVFLSAESEYDSRQTLPEFSLRLANRYRITHLAATGKEGSGADDIPGLEALDYADLLVLFARRRALPVAQMDHLERFIRSGRPLIVLRTSTAAFQPAKAAPGHVIWERFDQEVLGCNYQGYNPKSRRTGCDVWCVPEAAGHPILKGVAPRWHSTSWLYRVRPLAPGTTVLVMGRWSTEDPDEPIAWINTYAGAKVFFTMLGHPDDFRCEPFVRLLHNAIHWALDEGEQGEKPAK